MNSEQVSFESFADAGERLCGPDIGRELDLWLLLVMGAPDVQLR